MMASLYQSSPAPDTPTSSARAMIRLSTGNHLAQFGYPEDVSRRDGRVQPDPVARPAPGVARIAEQVVHFEGLVGVEPELGQRQLDEALVRPEWVQVDDHDDRVRAI